MSIAQNLIAAAILWALAKLYSSAKPSISKVAGVAIPATKKMLPSAAIVAIDIFVMWYLVSQLRASINAEPPLSGEAVAAIAFWMWWFLFYFIKICRFDYVKRKER